VLLSELHHELSFYQISLTMKAQFSVQTVNFNRSFGESSAVSLIYESGEVTVSDSKPFSRTDLKHSLSLLN
jgi:hypothetical protein